MMSKTEFNAICILGLGYIGLPTSVAFANAGKQVIGVDINPQVVESLNQGNIHIIEPDLQTAFTQAVKKGNFFATAKPQPADAFIIAVPTPLCGKQPDLTYIQNAAAMIAPCLRKGNLVVLERNDLCVKALIFLDSALIKKRKREQRGNNDRLKNSHF